MKYSVSPCTDSAMTARGLKFEVVASHPNSPNKTCVALCYEQEKAGKLASALNAVALKA